MYSCTHLPVVSWIRRFGSQSGAPHTMGWAEQWFCLLKMLLCFAGTETLCLVSPAASGRCEGRGAASFIWWFEITDSCRMGKGKMFS